VALLLYRPSYLVSVNGCTTGNKIQIFMCKLHNIKTLLTLALHGGEKVATCQACFTTRERYHKTTSLCEHICKNYTKSLNNLNSCLSKVVGNNLWNVQSS
jgi:hypothetical protein